MQEPQQKPQLLQQVPGTEEEVLDLQQCEIELLREQVQCLKLELRDKNQQLLETEQELQYTNEDLSAALESKCLTLDAAKQLAREILAQNLPTREALAALLSTVYDAEVKPRELGQSSMSPIQLSSL